MNSNVHLNSDSNYNENSNLLNNNIKNINNLLNNNINNPNIDKLHEIAQGRSPKNLLKEIENRKKGSKLFLKKKKISLKMNFEENGIAVNDIKNTEKKVNTSNNKSNVQRSDANFLNFNDVRIDFDKNDKE